MKPVALIDEPVPATCLVQDVLKHLRLSRRTFDRLMATKQLPIVELERYGRLRRFTGESVARAKQQTRWSRRAAA